MLGNLSLSKQFEMKCATSIPTCVIRIKHAGFFSFGVTLNNQTLQPNTMGSRAATLAGAFARYRIIKAIFKQVPTLGYGAQGRVYMGVSDDNGGEGGTSVVPADYLQITALRCSTNVSLVAKESLNGSLSIRTSGIILIPLLETTDGKPFLVLSMRCLMGSAKAEPSVVV